MATNLNVTELDFEDIKDNLKSKKHTIVKNNILKFLDKKEKEKHKKF